MKLLLIDGHYYVYRSFFAIQNLSNSRGEPTNAIFGFPKTLRLMLKHLQPELGAVFWDEGLPQKRMELQPAYKETRVLLYPGFTLQPIAFGFFAYHLSFLFFVVSLATTIFSITTPAYRWLFL